MSSVHERFYWKASSLLPHRLAARLDLARVSYRTPWGGALNGQQVRQQIVRDLARALSVVAVAETGTYRGTSTEFFVSVFGTPVYTVEVNPRYFEYARRRLAFDPRVVVSHGDSRTFLRELAGRMELHDAVVFVYLDAHWQEDLPLRQELELIVASWPAAIVMIDDFKVPGDGGYGFDDYGPGRTLDEDYLPGQVLRGWSLYYPAASSQVETGARRGSAVLAGPLVREQVAELPSLALKRVF